MDDANIGQSLGLSRQWKPTSVGWRWGGLRDTAGNRLHVLVFETEVGAFGVALSTDDVRKLANQCLEISTGLLLPPDQP